MFKVFFLCVCLQVCVRHACMRMRIIPYVWTLPARQWQQLKVENTKKNNQKKTKTKTYILYSFSGNPENLWAFEKRKVKIMGIISFFDFLLACKKKSQYFWVSFQQKYQDKILLCTITSNAHKNRHEITL